MNERTIILIGKTGEGKSALGNTILGMPKFESKRSGTSVTGRTTCETVEIKDKRVRVIDTPGVFDNRMPNNSNKWLEKEILKSIFLSVPGPHAFLYVMKPERLTEEHIKTTKNLLAIFGPKIYNHIILVFTHLDEFKPNRESPNSEEETLNSEHEKLQEFEKYLNSLPLYFKDFLKLCGERVIPVENNHSSSDEKKRFREKLIEMPLLKNNDYYKNKVLKEAMEKFVKRVEEVMKTNSCTYEEAVQLVLKEIENEKFFRKIKTGGVGAAAAVIAGSFCLLLSIPFAGAAAAVAGGVGATVTYNVCSIS